jgi:S1-C subfamily serine protease
VTRALANQQRVLTFSTRTSPKGYLGVTLNSEQRTEPRDGKVFTVFRSPAVIELVEPGSPAAKVGLEAGDTIVAFGRFTVPGAVPMGDIMVPGERLLLRIRGRSAERQVAVTVGSREVRGSVTINGLPAGASVPFDFVPAEAPAPPRPPVVAGQAARAPAAPAAPSVGVRMYEQRGIGWSSTEYSIAGAMMTSITSELESLTGVDEGILVLRVAPGTPAATSGLRGGDVIVRVNDDDVEGVADLQRAVQRASTRGERRVPMVVSRKQKETAITLQW